MQGQKEQANAPVLEESLLGERVAQDKMKARCLCVWLLACCGHHLTLTHALVMHSVMSVQALFPWSREGWLGCLALPPGLLLSCPPARPSRSSCLSSLPFHHTTQSTRHNKNGNLTNLVFTSCSFLRQPTRWTRGRAKVGRSSKASRARATRQQGRRKIDARRLRPRLKSCQVSSFPLPITTRSCTCLCCRVRGDTLLLFVVVFGRRMMATCLLGRLPNLSDSPSHIHAHRPHSLPSLYPTIRTQARSGTTSSSRQEQERVKGESAACGGV
jgi:hypothetical protein